MTESLVVSQERARWQSVVRLLADPASYGLAPDTAVERHETHISAVFLAGERAYKVKRPVAFGYLDFSTRDQRRAACQAELTVNRRAAPDLYLGLCPLRQGADGRLFLGGLDASGQAPAPDDVVDWVVVMRRFNTRCLLSEVLTREALAPESVDALAAVVADFHARAPVCARDPVAGHGEEIDGNTAEFQGRPDLFDAAAVAALDRASRATLGARCGDLAARAASGWVRHGHGDLHARNVVMLNDGPRLFDAIEFSAAFSEIDVLYDLAFLIMDLEQRGARWAANRVLTGYLARLDSDSGLSLLPLFLSLRAAIRAKVTAAAGGPAAEAGRYFTAAQAYLAPPAPQLLAIGGVSGTGKTTLARALAPDLGPAPGAVVLRSDVERKRLLGVGETERLPESAYRGATNAAVHTRLYARARTLLAAGHAVVLEATFLRREDRAQVRRLAEAAGVAWHGLWLQAPTETLMARVAERQGDASDATPEVVAAQLTRAPRGVTAWSGIDADGAPDTVAARARAVLDSDAGR